MTDPYAPPTGPSGAGPQPSAPGTGLGVAALVVGVVALLLGVSVVGGVVLGAVAVALGQRARRTPGGRGLGTAGVVLGVLGLLVALLTYLYVRDDLEEYRGCRKESVSLAQDRECERQLERGIRGE